MGLDLETGHCYQFNGLVILDLGFNYAFLGRPGLVQIYIVFVFFFPKKKRFALRQGCQATFVHLVQSWNSGLMPPFQSMWKKGIRNALG